MYTLVDIPDELVNPNICVSPDVLRSMIIQKMVAHASLAETQVWLLEKFQKPSELLAMGTHRRLKQASLMAAAFLERETFFRYGIADRSKLLKDLSMQSAESAQNAADEAGHITSVAAHGEATVIAVDFRNRAATRSAKSTVEVAQNLHGIKVA